MMSDLEHKLDLVLNDCLKSNSVDQCLTQYNRQDAEELKSLLIPALALNKLKPPVVTGKALFKAMAMIGKIESSTIRGAKVKFPKLVMKVAALFIAGLFLLTSLSVSGVESAPGEFLYTFKRLGEHVKYMLTPTSDGKANLHLSFSQARMSELLKLNNRAQLKDTELIKEMMSEANQALDKVVKTRLSNSNIPLSSIRDLNNRHGEILRHLILEEVNTPRSELNQFIELCKNKEIWFKELYSDNKTGVEEDDCHPGACCCPPNSEKLDAMIASYPTYKRENSLAY